jgi:septin 3/9/12
LQEQNKIFLEAERFRNFRYHQNDNRVHLILYFLTPFGGKVKEMDMDSLKKLSQVANVIPVIGKADCLTADERKLYKDTASCELATNQDPQLMISHLDYQATCQKRDQNLSL